MADLSIIISSNADQVSKDIKDLGKSALSSVDQALRLTQQMDKLAAAHNDDKISIQQYGNEMAKLQTKQDALYASIGKTTQAEDEQAGAANRAAQAAKKLADQTEMLRDKYQKGYAAGKQLSAATKELNTALKLGVISAKQHKLQVAELGREYQRAGKYSKGFSAMQRMSGKSTNKFGMISQQVGYQVGDFAVQVQSGTNALVAFGQQGTQLAGLIPGLGGAIIGIGLAIGTALAKVALESKGLTIDFKAVKKSFGDALTPIKPLIDGIKSAFSLLGGVVKQVGSIIADNIARAVSYAIAFAVIIGVKLVYSFVRSGKAAGAFFKLFKAGLISTGIGVFVIALGEILLAMNNMITNAGSLASAWSAVKDVFKGLWEYAGAQVDVYVARLKTIGPMMRNFIYATISVVLEGVERLINKAIGGINTMLTKVGLSEIGDVSILGEGFNKEITEAQNQLALAETNVQSMKNVADGTFNKMLDDLNIVLGLAKGAQTTLDTSSWLVPETNDDDEDKSKSEDPIAKLKREIKLNAEIMNMSKEKVDVLTQVRDIQKQLADDGKTYDEVKLVALVKYNEELKKQRAFQQSLAQTMASSMDTAITSMVDGTKSVKDAFRDMARDIVKHLFKVLVVQQMINNLGGIMSKSSNSFVSSIGGGLESYGSMDGGGYTGDGSRSGGLDGKGGFMMMMHPKETVIDHTKPNSGRGGGDTYVTNNYSISANTSEDTKRLVTQTIQQATPTITANTKASIMNDRRRGGQMKSVFG